MLAVPVAGQQSMRRNSTPSSISMGKVLSARAVLAILTDCVGGLCHNHRIGSYLRRPSLLIDEEPGRFAPMRRDVLR
jgi:hypothetical protein